MSKSLKNFLTVKDTLKMVNARTLRLYFALHRYDSLINFNSETSFSEARDKDRRFKEFFLKARNKIDTMSVDSTLRLMPQQVKLISSIQEAQQTINSHLSNNFDFPAVVNELDRLVTLGNSYITAAPKPSLLQMFYRVLAKNFALMGIEYSIDEGSSAESRKEVIGILCEYRDQVRKHAIGKDFGAILDVNDHLRDVVLPKVGVKLEDGRVGEPSAWLLDDPEEIIKEKAVKLEEQKKKQESKRKAEEERKRREDERLKQMKIKPEEMFLAEKDKFSEFDEKGIPTLDIEGKPLKEKFRKKLEKQFEEQTVLHSKYLEQEKPE